MTKPRWLDDFIHCMIAGSRANHVPSHMVEALAILITKPISLDNIIHHMFTGSRAYPVTDRMVEPLALLVLANL